jgi:hypothetical protein
VASSHDSGIRNIEFIAAGSRSHNIFDIYSGSTTFFFDQNSRSGSHRLV